MSNRMHQAAKSVVQTLFGIFFFGDWIDVYRASGILLITAGTIFYTWTQAQAQANARSETASYEPVPMDDDAEKRRRSVSVDESEEDSSSESEEDSAPTTRRTNRSGGRARPAPKRTRKR